MKVPRDMRGSKRGVHAALLLPMAIALLALSGCYPVDTRTVPEAAERSSGVAIVTSPLDPGRLLGTVGFGTRFPWAKPPGDDGEALRLEPVPTPWAEPWDHDAVIRGMDRILHEAGVDSLTARSRMTAHAIIASGWKQNVFHHNAWGVKRGSWDGPWFRKGTTEMTDIGFMTTIDDAEWRAFDSWQQAVDDYLSRISRESERPSYRKAARFLFDRDFRSDDDYWKALSEGNYYTGQALTPERFGFICYRVRQTVPRD